MTAVIKKVLLVVPPLVSNEGDDNLDPTRPDFESYRLVSPVEPASAAADLLRRGYDVRLFDMGAYMNRRLERLESYACRFKPDAVVAVQSILTFATAQDADCRQVFEAARREVSGCVAVLTGSHATNYPGRAVEDGVCDFSIRGEVDFALGELFDGLNQGRELSFLPGLARRNHGGGVEVNPGYAEVDVTLLPLPAYHILDPEQKVQYTKMLEYAKIRFPEKSPRYRDIMTSRGCTLRCSFCSVAYLRGEKQAYRRKTLEQVFAEIEQALADGIEEIHFFDDLFARSERQIMDFTNEIARRNLKFHWFVAQGMPLWPLTKDALSAMKETGLYRLISPFESGSDRVLKDVVGKKFSTVEHHHNVVLWAGELGLEIIGMFVVGMPGETRRDILDTLDFAAEHPEIDYSVFSIATPMVGTRLMKQVTEKGWLKDSGSINRVIKRTVALFETDEVKSYEMGVIRAFDWDRINFSTQERCAKYAGMVGTTQEQLNTLREHSKRTFYRFFPDYDGPLSFFELYAQPGLYRELEPVIPQSLY